MVKRNINPDSPTGNAAAVSAQSSLNMGENVAPAAIRTLKQTKSYPEQDAEYRSLGATLDRSDSMSGMEGAMHKAADKLHPVKP